MPSGPTGTENRPPRRRQGRYTRREFVAGSAAAGAAMAAGVFVSPDPGVARALGAATSMPVDATTSTFFATTFIEYAASVLTNSDGDLWPTCWADDDNLYGANGDGRGFSDLPFADVVVNRITGTPDTAISGERLATGADVANVWADPSLYNRKPTGIICVDGALYLAVQDLRTPPCPACFNDAPNASISRSDDHGRTWQKTRTALFTDHRFTTVFFIDYGKDNGNAVHALGPANGRYVYAYGLDGNWRDSYSDTVPDPTSLYLARVPKEHIQDRSRWEFFSGLGEAGRPRWSGSIDARVAVLTDTRRVYPTVLNGYQGISNITVISQGSVVYNRPLRRYLYTSWTEYTFEFYEAPQPWGPWKLFFRHDAGGYPWFGASSGDCPGPKNGGYATTIPSKFISADGRSMWVQSNWFVGSACGRNDYNFSLRRLRLAPHTPSKPSNGRDGHYNLARTGQGVTPIEKSAHFGHWQYYNDGNRTQSEDSFDQENKPLDFWGYTFERTYNIDRVVYTTGNMFPDGGWFSSNGGGLRVQTRQNFHWVDVKDLHITPAYPYDASAGPNHTYMLKFRPTWGDGVRIVGPPGGSSFFTSIAELEVYYGG
jgi:hypothetical protein